MAPWPSPSSSNPNINLTLSVPPGSTNHGNPRLLCTPPTWSDLIIFYFSNYIAHAATVISAPGQPWTESLEVALFALLLPMSGAARAISAIRNHAATYRDPVRRAARAGALCMVGVCDKQRFRGKAADRLWWEADKGEDYETRLEQANVKIGGKYSLKGGKYCLLVVPPTAAVSLGKAAEGQAEDGKMPMLASSYNFPKLLVGFIQAVWATVSLYRARGNQIHMYGYAAFGLTVAQYAFMSFVNIMGTLLRPEYPYVLMIRTPLMDEAEKNGCTFEGELKPQIGEGKHEDDWFMKRVLAELFIGVLLGLFPLAIVGSLSEFKKQASTPLERGFTMTWLVVSILIGPIFRFLHAGLADFLEARLIVIGIGACVFGLPAVGGMVVVGRMIQKFGTCSLIG